MFEPLKLDCISVSLYNSISKVKPIKIIRAATSENGLWPHAPSEEDSNQPVHSRSQIRILTGRSLDSQRYKDSLSGQQRLWWDWTAVWFGSLLRRYVFARCGSLEISGSIKIFAATDLEIFSTVIHSLPLIQEGQLSVSGERMCAITG